MPSEQLPPVRVKERLRNQIQRFGATHGIESESEAIRELLRRGLREENLSKLLLLSVHRDLNDIIDSAPELIDSLGESWLNLLNSPRNQIDIVEIAGGDENISKRELMAAYRFQRGEATADDIVKIGELLVEIEETDPERLQEQLENQLL